MICVRGRWCLWTHSLVCKYDSRGGQLRVPLLWVIISWWFHVIYTLLPTNCIIITFQISALKALQLRAQHAILYTVSFHAFCISFLDHSHHVQRTGLQTMLRCAQTLVLTLPLLGTLESATGSHTRIKFVCSWPFPLIVRRRQIMSIGTSVITCASLAATSTSIHSSSS